MLIQTIIRRSFVQQLDRLILYNMNRTVPDSLESSYHDAPLLAEVLAKTRIDRRQTAVYTLTAPGEHAIWLQTEQGEIKCHVRVRPAVNPAAPLLVFHHGFNELPYTSSWQRIFPAKRPFPFHLVAIQAPYHTNWREPMAKGFASVTNMYQLFAGSMRLIELMQDCFEAEGAEACVVAGISWGGITGILYEALFQRSRAIITLLSSPHLAQVIEDIAALFHRPLPISAAQMADLLDFTPYYERCDQSKLFPLLGEDDLFFRFDKHAPIFAERPLTIIPGGHISAMWHSHPLRQHILNVMATVQTHSVSHNLLIQNSDSI